MCMGGEGQAANMSDIHPSLRHKSSLALRGSRVEEVEMLRFGDYFTDLTDIDLLLKLANLFQKRTLLTPAPSLIANIDIP